MAIDLIGFLRCCFLNVDPFHAETRKHTRTHKKQWRNAFKVISHFSSLPLFAYPCWKFLPQTASCGECLFVVREAVWRKKKSRLATNNLLHSRSMKWSTVPYQLTAFNTTLQINSICMCDSQLVSVFQGISAVVLLKSQARVDTIIIAQLHLDVLSSVNMSEKTV